MHAKGLLFGGARFLYSRVGKMNERSVAEWLGRYVCMSASVSVWVRTPLCVLLKLSPFSYDSYDCVDC